MKAAKYEPITLRYYFCAAAVRKRAHQKLNNPNIRSWEGCGFHSFQDDKDGVRFVHTSGQEVYVHEEYQCGNIIVDITNTARGQDDYFTLRDLEQLLKIKIVSRMPFVHPLRVEEKT